MSIPKNSIGRLYLDFNVYDFIARDGDAIAVRRHLDRARVQVFASVQTAIEAMRIDADDTREKLIQTILTVAAARESEPRGYIGYRQIRSEVERCHPDWLTQRPNHNQVLRDRLWSRTLWANLERNPRHRPLNFSPTQPALHHYLGQGAAGQRLRRRTRARGLTADLIAKLGPIATDRRAVLGSMAEDELHWRAVGGFLVWLGLQGEPGLADVHTWLGPYIDLTRVDQYSWLDFWIREVRPEAIPIHRAELLTELYQLDYKVRTSNAMDILHSPYLLEANVFATADRDFHSLLQRLAAAPDLPAGVAAFVDRTDKNVMREVARLIATCRKTGKR